MDISSIPHDTPYVEFILSKITIRHHDIKIKRILNFKKKIIIYRFKINKVDLFAGLFKVLIAVSYFR